MIFLGLDWAEGHHDIALLDEAGAVVKAFRVADSVTGLQRLHELVAAQDVAPDQVIVGMETAHGLLPQALLAAGYVVYEINPLASSRYRDRHHLSGAKSDKADAKMLADLVRTDRHNHRPFIADSPLASAIQVVARSHQSLIWARQHHLNQVRSTLRQYFPAMLVAFPDMCSASARDCPDAMAVLRRAPTPAQARALSRTNIGGLLRRAGRHRRLDERAGEIQQSLRAPQLETSAVISQAYALSVRASVEIITAMTQQIATLERELGRHFEQHPDAEIYCSLPGLGVVLGARVLAEFGDKPNCYQDARARKNYATTSPVTRASGTTRIVSRRHGGNRRLGEICLWWAFTALRCSPGARRQYDALRARKKTDSQARRVLANRLVGILHACLSKHQRFCEEIAWPLPRQEEAA